MSPEQTVNQSTTSSDAPSKSEGICHEIAIAKALPGVDAQKALAALREAQAWVATQPGFLGRELFQDEATATFIDHIRWESSDAAQKAMAQFETSACAGAMMETLELQSMQMFHAHQVRL